MFYLIDAIYGKRRKYNLAVCGRDLELKQAQNLFRISSEAQFYIYSRPSWSPSHKI
jgi:hypothetical protein